MRILLVTDWLRLQGGVETYFGTIRDGLARAGHEVTMLTSNAGNAARGSAEFTAFGTERVAAQTILQVANPFAVAAVRRAIRATQPDVAFVGMFEQHLSPAAVRALGAIPTVLSIADYKPVCPIHSKLLPDGSVCTARAGPVCWRGGCVGLGHWLRDRPRYALIRSCLQQVDRIVTCSCSMQRELAANGIDAHVLHLPASPVSPGFVRAPVSRPLLVFVGRLSREKGVDLLLRAFARVRPVHSESQLRIIGDGDERNSLRDLATELGLDDAVTFTGWLGPAEVERELAGAWALVVPSRWVEPFGIVALEGISRGVPVIAPASGGFVATVSEGRSGLLFPRGDWRALADRMDELISGQSFPSRTLAPEVVAESELHSGLDHHIGHLEGVLHEAIANHAHRRTTTRSSAPAA